MATEGLAPLPRDSHVAVVYGHSMFIFGGSTGSAMDDFHELDLELGEWAPVNKPSGASSARSLGRSQSPGVSTRETTQLEHSRTDRDRAADSEGGDRVRGRGAYTQPGFRFCHVACVYRDSMYIFGGEFWLILLYIMSFYVYAP